MEQFKPSRQYHSRVGMGFLVDFAEDVLCILVHRDVYAALD